MRFLIPYVKLRTSNEDPKVFNDDEFEDKELDEYDHLSFDYKQDSFKRENDSPIMVSDGNTEENLDHHPIVEINEDIPQHSPKTKTPKRKFNYIQMEEQNNESDYKPNLKISNPGNTSHFEEECSDSLFLRSLLPDLKKLNDKQKRKYKQRALQLFDDILDENT